MAKITKQLTPLYHNVSYHTEFRIDSDNLKYSNIRLAGLYFETAEDGRVLNTSNGGITEFINSITLLSGNIQIDRCDNIPLLGCHRTNSYPNRTNAYLNLFLTQNNYSSEIINVDPDEQVQIVPFNNGFSLNNQEGFLLLMEYLLFLKSTPVFNMPDIRIIIEWSSLAKSSTSNLEPFLIYEEAVGNNQPKFNGVSYSGWELDRFTIPSVEENTNQSIKYRFQGFNGKRVNRFIIAFTPVNIDTPYQAKLCSPAQKDEQYQIYWNNIAIYPENINQNTKTRLMLDTWGNKTQPFGQDLYNLYYSNAIENAYYYSKTQSWAGADMQGLPITNLQFSYSRTGFNNDPQPPVGMDSIKVFFFGEVLKQLSFNSKGQAVVSYL